MEDLLKRELNISSVRGTGQGGGGCINSGQVYDTEIGKIFVKENSKSGAKLMFDGEYASLDAIQRTKTVRVPKPMRVITRKAGAILVMECLEMRSLNTHAKILGRKLAELHLNNVKLIQGKEKEESKIGDKAPPVVEEFGFDQTTCCGYLPLKNDWCKDWVEFYARNRLKTQLDMVEENYHDKEARSLWPQVERNLPKLFPGSLEIKPSLLHGDLWGGNAAELTDEPCVFDPASFYGHSEFDLAIAHMFGGFPSSFFAEYHKIIPKSGGYEKRLDLYKLFHYLNHWNHFGGGYRGTSISLMRGIASM